MPPMLGSYRRPLVGAGRLYGARTPPADDTYRMPVLVLLVLCDYAGLVTASSREVAGGDGRTQKQEDQEMRSVSA